MTFSGPARLLSLSLVAFGSFAWGTRRHFRRRGKVPAPMQVLAVASLLAYGHFVVRCRSGGAVPAGRTAAAASFSLATGLFWWAVAATRGDRPYLAHVREKPHVLYQSGPYRHVRHPFYLSYILFWTGTALAADRRHWPAASALISWYVLLARAEERRFARSDLGDAYASFRRGRPMFLPRCGPARQGHGHGA